MKDDRQDDGVGKDLENPEVVNPCRLDHERQTQEQDLPNQVEHREASPLAMEP